MSDAATGPEYVMHVFAPGQDTTILNTFRGPTPFMLPHVGDTIHPTDWGGGHPSGTPLVVARLAHFLEPRPDGSARQVVHVYTTQGPRRA